MTWEEKHPFLTLCCNVWVNGITIGETTSKDQLNLDIERLSTDVRNVIWTLFGGAKDPEGDQDGQEAFIPTKINETKLPKLFMVGHSMGGAIVANVARRGLLPNAVGIAVLDIVEGRLGENTWPSPSLALPSLRSI